MVDYKDMRFFQTKVLKKAIQVISFQRQGMFIHFYFVIFPRFKRLARAQVNSHLCQEFTAHDKEKKDKDKEKRCRGKTSPKKYIA